MTRYQVIAKKFRPQTFAEVFGQAPIITTLKNALRMQRVAHAYLFTGCRGSGKTTLVRLFAKAINCHSLSSDFEPCNACPSCLDIMSGRSLDILEIDGASNRGIDDIRQINDTVGYASTHGGYKIIIIDEVHMLTKEAFNALLKTLEEPPENVKFFFATTEPHKVLSTITSRCQRFDLARIPPDEMMKKLKRVAAELDIDIDDNALKLIIKISEGSLRDAESLLDQAICYQEGRTTEESIRSMLGLLPLDIFAKIDEAYAATKPDQAFHIGHHIFNSGIDLHYFFEMLLDHFRHILLFFYNISHEHDTYSAEAAEHYKKTTHIYSKETVLSIISYLTELLSHQGRASLRKIDIEMTLLYILRQKNRVTYEALTEHLNRIADKINTPKPTKGQEHTSTPPPQVAPPLPIIEERAVIEHALPPSPEPIPRDPPMEFAQQQSLLSSLDPKPMPSGSIPSEQAAESFSKPLEINMEKIKRETLLNFAAVELKGRLTSK
ncbi:MAG: DNA polymerase III subunit gamma/tau [Simkaniaceae bacterium]|nr:DNA polymerase III subunit gamma/tau [Simkaniaceae bacterium]MCF7852117.1 DNA polymerase III subunit gamma/tau [Simkaniaceae bacterium]